MAEPDEAYTRRRFVDFIYAVIIGAVFPSIAPLEPSFRFFGMLFLLFVILEDFYVAHTQLSTFNTPRVAHRFIPLVIELAISLSWYLSAIAFPAEKHAFLLAFSCFFVFKWLAGLVHWKALQMLSNWQFKRNFLFLICAAVCLLLLFFGGNKELKCPCLWMPIAIAWAIQTAFWWGITRAHGVIREVAEASTS